MNRRISYLALFVSLAVALPARAQQVTNLPGGTEQSVGVEAGFDSAFIVRGTYTHELKGVLPDAVVYARFTWPVASPDIADFAVDAGLAATVIGTQRWKVQLLLGPVIRNTSNDLFNATALGFRSGMLAGYRSDTWGLMAELGYEQILATYLRNSDLYKEKVYSDARDGWYSLTGGTFQLGLRGGGRIGRVELHGSLGVMTTEELKPLTPPYYGTLGTEYAF
jgi:hypothetical protein